MATDTPQRAPGPPGHAGDGARADILRYWHAVEMFSTQPAPRPGGDGRVMDVEGGTPMPWSPAADAAREALGQERVWRHAVYCGLFSLEEAYGALARVFPPTDDDIFGVPAVGEAALAAFVVDEDGFPLDGGHVLSECAWAVGRVLADNIAAGTGDGFAGAQAELGTLIAECGDGPLAAGDLQALAEGVHALTGLAGHIGLVGVRIRTFHVDRATTPAGGEGVLLNSFIADDLRRVGAAVGRGDYGHALWRYLAPEGEVDRDARCDVEADRIQVSAALAPPRIPAGRWPAPTAEPLASGQQLAVNEALHTLGHGGGILAVNGPPGTGKTTMLRDLIAAIVVDRARHLADLARAEDVFTGALPWGRTASERRVWGVRPHLGGAEIVLACATNAAAENVTTEIPGVGAIGEEWVGEADHLSSLATLVLRAWHESASRAGTRVDAPPPRAWGLVAACLGSRQKGADFTGAFWWGRLPSRRRGGRGGTQMRMAMTDGDDLAEGFHRTLRAAIARTEDATPTWADAVAAFRAAQAAVETGREEAAAEHHDADAWWADRTRRLRDAPWVNAGWNASRTRLFLAALGLQRALVEHAAKPMAQNLRAAVDIISGRTPAGVGREAARAAWQTLFLVVPVVSTTFASLPRLFAHLGREDLGWLLIDEAGQAAPQQAVGAIWRARRAVVVGDPRQLEPIVSLPVATQDGLRIRRGVGEDWVPSRTSVQRLADRVSRTGTYDGRGDGARWVGSPLTLHRRCEEPMFGIVNAMAYGERMVNGTPGRDPSPLPPSGWLDVVGGGSSEGHWVPAEGTRLDGVLAYLDHRGHDLTQVLVVSPFRDVARALRVHARRWPGVTAGTVHTAQGREADVVIVVLGGAPGRDGAIRWATRRPNLLNVAVSRARRRLWVIGDRDLWRRYPHAEVIAARLPVKR